MECVIFLLALCAFKAVFAVNPQGNPVESPYVKQMGDMHHKYTTEMAEIVQKFQNDAEELVVLTQPKNTQVINCLAEYHELERYYRHELTECDYCYTNALRRRLLQVAEKCYLKRVINLTSDIAKRTQEIRVCIRAILAGGIDCETYTMRRAPIAGPSTSH